MSHGGRIDKLIDQYGNKVGPDRIYKGSLGYPGITISRSLGNFQAKDCGVISAPEINECSVSRNSKYLVICSKGVWEFFSNEDVRDLAYNIFKKGDSKLFCSSLAQQAARAWELNDVIRADITIICVCFNVV